MSKMPALSKSFQSVSLKTFNRSGLFGSCVEALKSGTANRTFSTPSPVPVRIQSCWAQVGRLSNRSKAIVQLRNSFMNFFFDLHAPSVSKLYLSLVIEPELNGNLIPRIIRGQGTKSINALDSSYC